MGDMASVLPQRTVLRQHLIHSLKTGVCTVLKMDTRNAIMATVIRCDHPYHEEGEAVLTQDQLKRPEAGGSK